MKNTSSLQTPIPHAALAVVLRIFLFPVAVKLQKGYCAKELDIKRAFQKGLYTITTPLSLESFQLRENYSCIESKRRVWLFLWLIRYGTAISTGQRMSWQTHTHALQLIFQTRRIRRILDPIFWKLPRIRVCRWLWLCIRLIKHAPPRRMWAELFHWLDKSNWLLSFMISKRLGVRRQVGIKPPAFQSHLTSKCHVGSWQNSPPSWHNSRSI